MSGGKPKKSKSFEDFPESLKIMGTVYRIRFMNKYLKAVDLYGEIKYRKLKIKLSALYPRHRTEQSLLHEMVHGIIHEVFMGDNEKWKLYNDEVFIVPFANLLHQVLKENDFSFLREKHGNES
jgi:hypothetical protein